MHRMFFFADTVSCFVPYVFSKLWNRITLSFQHFSLLMQNSTDIYWKKLHKWHCAKYTLMYWIHKLSLSRLFFTPQQEIQLWKIRPWFGVNLIFLIRGILRERFFRFKTHDRDCRKWRLSYWCWLDLMLIVHKIGELSIEWPPSVRQYFMAMKHLSFSCAPCYSCRKMKIRNQESTTVPSRTFLRV